MANGYQSREARTEWVSGFNNTGSTILKGTIVNKGTTTDYIVVASAATQAFLGVADADIPTGSWGTVITGGRALVRFNAAQTVGARLTSNGTGLAVAAASGNAVLGIANEVGASGGTLAEVELAGPGGQTMP